MASLPHGIGYPIRRRVGDDEIRAHRRAAYCEAGGHVIAVSYVRHSESTERPLVLGDCLQVGHCLARMLKIGERVDDRDVHVSRHGHQRFMLVHAGDDTVDPTVENTRDIFHRLADAEVHVLFGKVYAVPAKLSDSDLEAHTRSERGLLEEQRDELALQGPRVGSLQALRLPDDVRDLGGGEIGYCEKVLLHAVPASTTNYDKLE